MDKHVTMAYFSSPPVFQHSFEDEEALSLPSSQPSPLHAIINAIDCSIDYNFYDDMDDFFYISSKFVMVL